MVVSYAILAHSYFGQVDLVNALRGFSALEVLAQYQFPENFERNYPGGAGLFTQKSLITMLYIPLFKITGLSGQTLQYIMIGLEVISVTVASLYLMFILMKAAQVSKVVWPVGIIGISIVINLSFVIRPDLANFSFPYYHGQFYGFGDAVRLAAIAFFMQKRWPLMALWLSVGFAIHPIKTIMAMIFMAGGIIVDYRKSLSLASMFWGAVSLTAIAAWSYWILGLGQTGSHSLVPLELFSAYTRIFQMHWYPIDMGYLGSNYHASLVPFLGLISVMFLALAQSELPKDWVMRIIAGFVILAIVTVGGIWVSYDLTSITLLKVCLIRASTLMTLLAPFLILVGILVQWDKGSWHWVAFYIVFLMFGFVKVELMSPVFFVLGVTYWIWEKRSSHWPIITLAGLVLLVQLILLVQNPGAENPFKIFISLRGLIGGTLIATVASILITIHRWPTWLRLGLSVDRSRYIGVICIFIMGALQWGYFEKSLSVNYVYKAKNYKEAQIWAKNNTNETDLFMVDPCISYGWRDFSHRSSIGTPREWYMTGWLYLGEKRLFDLGLEIGETFGLNLQPYLPKKGEKPEINTHDVCCMATDLYYNPTMTSIRNISQRYNVDYFVFDKQKLNTVSDWPNIKPVFENDHFLVVRKDDLLR
ncbi:MAG: hypothetical protein C0582_01630 [Alphaproteobacteria bacterium]|nr:MAG: hypothetical protein C0582_01630 [Alphaproteobacteria bacterium]